jgi:hypothetical protein
MYGIHAYFGVQSHLWRAETIALERTTTCIEDKHLAEGREGLNMVKGQRKNIVDSTTVEGTGAALTDAGTPAALGRWPRQTVFSDGGMGETGMH